MTRKRRSKYDLLIDGEGVEMEANKTFKFACCDCGLVHNVAVAVPGRRVFGLAMERNPRATAARRRWMATSAKPEPSGRASKRIRRTG